MHCMLIQVLTILILKMILILVHLITSWKVQVQLILRKEMTLNGGKSSFQLEFFMRLVHGSCLEDLPHDSCLYSTSVHWEPGLPCLRTFLFSQHQHLRNILLISQLNRSTDLYLTTMGHYGGEFSIDFYIKCIEWEEVNNEISAIQLKSLQSGKAPQECSIG